MLKSLIAMPDGIDMKWLEHFKINNVFSFIIICPISHGFCCGLALSKIWLSHQTSCIVRRALNSSLLNARPIHLARHDSTASEC